jgi:hypothetical protein
VVLYELSVMKLMSLWSRMPFLWATSLILLLGDVPHRLLLPKGSRVCHNKVYQPLLVLLNLFGKSLFDHLAGPFLRHSLVLKSLRHHLNRLQAHLVVDFALLVRTLCFYLF